MASNLFKRSPIIDNSGTLYSDWKWITDNGTLIIEAHDVAGNGNTTMYTVPAGKNFYIITSCIAQLNTAASATGMIKINNNSSANTTNSIIQAASTATVPNIVVSVSYSIPLKLSVGDIVYVVGTGAASLARASIVGYLVNV